MANDALCVPCYDELKIAYNFRKKCIQTDALVNKESSTLTHQPGILVLLEMFILICANIESIIFRLYLYIYIEVISIGVKTDALPSIEQMQIQSTSGPVNEKISRNNTHQIIENSSDEQNNDADISEAETIASTPIKSRPFVDACSATTFTCGDCGRTFSRIGNLRRHENVIHSKHDPKIAADKRRTIRKTKQTENADGKHAMRQMSILC